MVSPLTTDIGGIYSAEIEKFKEHLETENLSEHTFRGYMGDIRDYLEYLVQEDIPLSIIDTETITGYLHKRDYLKASTAGRRISSIRKFASCILDQKLSDLPSKELLVQLGRKTEESDETVLREEEFARMISYINSHNKSMKVARTILASSIAFRTGITLEQIINLDEQDVEIIPEKAHVSVEIRLRDKPPAAYTLEEGMEAETTETYKDKLNIYRQKRNTSHPALFINKFGGRIITTSLTRHIKMLQDPKAKVAANFRILRRSHIKNKVNQQTARTGLEELGLNKNSLPAKSA